MSVVKALVVPPAPKALLVHTEPVLDPPAGPVVAPVVPVVVRSAALPVVALAVAPEVVPSVVVPVLVALAVDPLVEVVPVAGRVRRGERAVVVAHVKSSSPWTCRRTPRTMRRFPMA